MKAATSLDFSKPRISGGEPLVKSIFSICQRAAAVEGIRDVCLTTNGTLLPRLAKSLRQTGVDRVNISLDTLNEAKYSHITRWDTLSEALDGLDSAIGAGFERIKINTVLINGFNNNEIRDLTALTKKYPVDVRFIELMPMYDSGEFGQIAIIPREAIPENNSGKAYMP